MSDKDLFSHFNNSMPFCCLLTTEYKPVIALTNTTFSFLDVDDSDELRSRLVFGMLIDDSQEYVKSLHNKQDDGTETDFSRQFLRN